MMQKFLLINAMLLFGNIACVHGKDIPNGRGTDSQQCSKTESSGPETIVAKGVKTREELDRWKEAYVAKHYPGYEISDEEMEILGKESIMEILYLDNGKGDAVKLHVNITEYIKKFRQKNRQEIARMIKQQKKVNREEVQGLSYEFPIDLKHAVTEESVLEAQKKYLAEKFPEYQIVSRGIWLFGKKIIDRLRLEKDGGTKVLMFDVSAYMNEYKKKHEIQYRQIAPGMIRVEK